MLWYKTSVIAAAIALLCLCASFTSDSDAELVNEQEVIEMSLGLFKTKGRLDAVFPNLDFDAQCQVQSFRMVKVSRRTDPIMIQNRGSDFRAATLAVINQAKPGDHYFFENIKSRCPGDYSARNLAPIVVKIK